MNTHDLPIEQALPELLAALSERTEAVLQAPPGAGKTTLVPLVLLEQSWLEGGKIVMLEPRRMAARAAARRMAYMLGETVGQTVGHRVRGDTKVGPSTRVEVVTEGVLTRMLQSDPSLDGVACVIFDEFHERNVQADLGLALALDARSALRPDLRILVMSATLDGTRVAALLEDAPIVTSLGRSFDVSTHYLDRVPEGRIEHAAVRATHKALRETDGDILVFLPGAGEIRRAADQLANAGAHIDIRPLFGALSFEKQDLALAPSPPGRRKIVLATDIAETSLTIEGVRVVVDTGWARSPLFDESSGMSRLVTRKTSKASADQRRGRAGREAPGVCYRLWTKVDQAARSEYAEPEILGTDMTPLMLELANWGVTGPADLSWLDAPKESMVDSARDLLHMLGAVKADGRITAHGRAMSRLAVHPRLAHMLLVARDQNLGAVAADIAVLMEERDVFRSTVGPPLVDIRLRLQALKSLRAGETASAQGGGGTLDMRALRNCEVRSRELRRQLRVRQNRENRIDAAGSLVAAAYPDRVSCRVASRENSFRTRGGRPLGIAEADPLSQEAFLAVATVGGSAGDHRVFLAAPLSVQEIDAQFAPSITQTESTHWDPNAERVRSVRRRELGAVILSEGPAENPDAREVSIALLSEVARRGLHLLPWDKESRRLQNRLEFLRQIEPSWPDVSDAGLLERLTEWLGPFAAGLSTLSDLKRLDLREALLSDLDWRQRQALDRRAPTHCSVPSGSRLPLDYSDPAQPVLPVRLQEVFGWTKTPEVAGVPLTLHLLSPAGRPVQITQDLAGFWDTSYHDVRKDMRGRYPKHYWPENPLTATPTSRAKPRKR